MRSIVGVVASLLLIGVVAAACGGARTAGPSPTPSSSPDLFAAPEALLRAGYVADAATAAEDALKKALETDPTATLPPDLQDLPGQEPPVSRWLYGSGLFRWVNANVAGALPLVPAAIAILAVALIVRRRWVLRSRLSMGAVAGPVPGDASKNDDAPDLAGPIAVEIDRLRQEGAGAALGLASGVDAALALPTPVASAAPAAAWVAALADLIGHPRAELSGRIGPNKPPSGRNITLSLKWSDGRADTVSLAAREYTELPPPSDPGATNPSGVVPQSPTAVAPLSDASALDLLGLASAAWVAYRLSPKDTRWPTADWRSFALTRAGASLYEDGERDRARWLHTEALARDPDNRVALFNLGALDTNTDPSAAVARLTRALYLVERANLASASPFDSEASPWHRDRLWYRVMYNLAAATYMCWWTYTFGQKLTTPPPGWPSAGPPSPAELDRVLTQVHTLAVELIGSADDRRAARTRRWRPGPSAEERSFLLMTRQTTMVLLAAVCWHELAKLRAGTGTAKQPLDVDNADPESLIKEVLPDSALDFLPPRVHYNLACYFVERGREVHDTDGNPILQPTPGQVPPPDSPPNLERAWKHLAAAMLDRRHTVVASTDPMLIPLQGLDKGRWEKIMSRGGQRRESNPLPGRDWED